MITACLIGLGMMILVVAVIEIGIDIMLDHVDRSNGDKPGARRPPV